jgi:protein MAK11
VDDSDEFAVGFDRDIVVFGMDSVPKCRVMGSIRSKIHQFFYVQVDEEADITLLAAATEDGRILFFSTKDEDLTKPDDADDKKSESLPTAKLVGQIGGKADGVDGRIKDFVVIKSATDASRMYVAGGSSDGRVRLWRVSVDELQGKKKKQAKKGDDAAAGAGVGKLLGTYETRNRITCMTAFLMIPRPEGAEESEYEFSDEEDEEESDSDED